MSTNNPTPPADNHNVVQSLEALRNPDYASMRKAVADGFADAAAKGALDPKNMSQSVFQDKRNEMQMEKNSYAKKAADYKRTGNILDDFEQGIKDELLDALAGGDFKKGVQDALSTFTKEFGFELKDLPHELGKNLGKKLLDSDLGQSFKKQASKLGDRLLNSVFDVKNADQKSAKDALSNVFKSFLKEKGGSGAEVASQAAANAGSSGAELASVGASAGSSGVATAGSGLNSSALSGITSAGASLAVVAAALLVFIIAMKPLLEGLGKFIKGLLSSFNKDEDMRKKRLEQAQKRLEADMEYIVREPFEILTNAAKKWEETWDANLAKVALTQGYTKEDVYDLYEAIAIKLKEEGLDSAIAATDVISNLSSILDAGLSGTIAQAFAYESTKLNAAIPTQNFTGYAATYAQLASEAVARGASEGEAVSYANEQLELFASNLLYSSRTLTGGFTTGLQNAESLFKSAVDIAQTAKTSNAAAISGTLTAVSGVLGSVAPDLAQGLVQNIVDAAIGGNSDTIVALRSLAGVNAGNTDFLRQLASDPKGLFVSIFQSLGELQSMSPDNYMEVAEGLASVFGVDMKALARVDFASLAAQISTMEVNQASLEENMALLQSGQATMSTEQLKLQEINNMILDEGLAYVIDSEAGRAMQEHMWEEQMNDALMQNEYAVNLQGAALGLLEGLRHTVANIFSFLNPLGYIADGVERIVATFQQEQNNTLELAQILQLGAVGGNQTALNNLLNYSGADLGLTRTLVEMMGGEHLGTSSTWLSDLSNVAGWISSPAAFAVSGLTYLTTGNAVNSAASWNRAIDSIGGSQYLDWFGMVPGHEGALFQENHGGFGISSLYSGFTTGKSALSIKGTSKTIADVASYAATSATQAALEDTSGKWQEFFDSAETAAGEMSVEAWLATAKNYGIDLSDIAESGMTLEQIKGYYQSFQAGEAGKAEQQRKADEQQFWEDGRQFFDEAKTALANIQTTVDNISEKIGDNSEYTVISVLGLIYTDMQSTFVKSSSSFQKCLADWLRYMAEVKSYQTSISSAQAWSDLKQAEGQAQQETLLALANAMQVFSADELKKLDPQLQANALLGQIIVILQTMLQQNSTVAGGISLPETLSALGFGMTFQTNT